MTIKGSATVQDLLNTPKDGNKYELVDGEIVMSPAGMRHSEVAGNIFGFDLGICAKESNRQGLWQRCRYCISQWQHTFAGCHLCQYREVAGRPFTGGVR